MQISYVIKKVVFEIVPSKVEERFDILWYAVFGPCQKVELSDRARLILFQVLQEEVPHQVIFAPDMLRHQMYLET